MEKIMSTTKLYVIFIVSALFCFIVNYSIWSLVGDTHMNILGMSIFIGLLLALVPTFYIHMFRYATKFHENIESIEILINSAKTKAELEIAFDRLKILDKDVSFHQQGYEIKRLKGLMDMKYNLLCD